MLTTKIRKSLGQVFLQPHSSSLLLITKTIPTNTKLVEIGFGPCVFTEKIIQERKCFVHGIEIDKQFLSHAKRLHQNHPSQFQYEFGDAKSFNFTHAPYKTAVGNLPYCSCKSIVMHLITFNHINLMCIMLQKELADKLITNRGVWSKIINCYFSVVSYTYVPRDHFSPEPKVHSAFVCLVRIHATNINKLKKTAQTIKNFALGNKKIKKCQCPRTRAKIMKMGVGDYRERHLSIKQVKFLCQD